MQCGFLGSIQIVSFSTHHLVVTFSHKSSLSLTVTELSDYITRRKIDKKSQYLNELKKDLGMYSFQDTHCLILYRLVLQIKKLIKQTLPYKKSLIHDSCQLAKKDLDMSGLFCYKWVEIIFEIAFIFLFPCLFRTYLSSILILLHFEIQ